jgi:transposase
MLVAYNVDERIPQDHPLRKIRAQVDARLKELSGQFEKAYATDGRPSIPPESLLKALLLQVLYSIRSERQLVDQINWNVLYRWFVDLLPDEPVWDPTTFTKNRDRFAQAGLVQAFFDQVVREAKGMGLVSSDHFSVDNTLIEAFASLKSFKPRDGSGRKPEDGDRGNPTVNFHGEKRSNKTHASKTDPDSMLMRKGNGKEAKLSHGASILMENRHGLCVAVSVHEPTPKASVMTAPKLVSRTRRLLGLKGRLTVGADKEYNGGPSLKGLERAHVTPHVPTLAPVYMEKPGAEARMRAYRRAKTKGYAVSQRVRKRIEEIFGWWKTVGQMRKTFLRRRWRVNLQALLTGAAWNLMRMTKCVA